MYKLEEIIYFIEEICGLANLKADDDIFLKRGVVGDVFHELIEKYSQKFKVDMSSYLWYFHTHEEGNSFGSSFFKAPNERVKRIPVTPKMLLDFVNSGKWNIDYPEHHIPKRRWNLVINKILLVVFIICVILFYFLKR